MYTVSVSRQVRESSNTWSQNGLDDQCTGLQEAVVSTCFNCEIIGLRRLESSL